MLLVYTGLAILIYMQFGAGENPRKNRNVCIAIGAFLFLISAMKVIDGRSDLANYAAKYRLMQLYWTAQEIIELWQQGGVKDVGFFLFGEFLSELGFTDYGWMAVIALLFGVGVAWFIYGNSAKPVLSLMLLMTLDIFYFSLSGLRQTMALSIVMLWSYRYMLDRKPWKFLLSVVIASFFHFSAVLFLPAYFIVTWKIGWKQAALVFSLLVIYFLFPGAVRWFLVEFAWSESVSAYATRTGGLTWSGVIIYLCILVFCLFFRNETTLTPYLKWRRVDAFINCMVVGLCLQILSTMIAEAFRMAYYYNVCCIAVVPNLVVENKRESNHSTMYILLALCLVAYMLWSKAYFDLRFFWQ